MEVYLISPSYVRTMSNASENLSDKCIQSAIREAQDMGLQTIVGECLYKALKDKVADSSIGKLENSAYKDLLDTAQYYLVYKVLVNVVMTTTWKLSNIGLNQTSDDNVRSATINECFKVKDAYENKADFYCKRLQEYILNNIKAFPELKPCDCAKMKANLYSAASTSVWLGGPRSRK